MPRPTRAPGGSRTQTPNARDEEREDIDSDQESGEDGSGKTQKAVNPRDAIINRMDERLTRLREREVAQSSGETDESEEDEEDQEPPSDGETQDSDDDDEDGTPDSEAGAEEAEEAPDPDPLEKFVVRQGGKTLFRLKVDGTERLIPLESVQTQLQKHEAADIRLQQASQTLKSAQEQAEQIRQQAALSKPAPGQDPPSNPDEDDEITEEASTLAKALLTEPEDQVAQKLAATLKKLRTPKVAPVNTQEIVTSVVKAVQKKTTEERLQEDMARGLEAFERDFPEINADPNLYRVADGLTDAIAQEHPQWTPSQVMAEAGKQTREWARKSGMKLPAPAQRPGTNDRQTRKQGLMPMPKAQSARRAPPAKKQEDNSPRSALAEIKKSRGQAY